MNNFVLISVLGVGVMGRRSCGLLNQIAQRIMEYEGHIYFVTLTMRDDGVLNRNTISNFVLKLKYRGVQIDGYLWVKELQRRGVVHYHMIILVPEMIRSFYDFVSQSWPHGFVFVRGVQKSKLRNVMVYIMKYMKKELNAEVENDKMKRRVGRGGILRFRIDTFVGRVARYSEFEYVGSMSTKGLRVKMYRCGNLVMFVSSGMHGVSIDIVECNVEKIVERMKYELDSEDAVRFLVNSPGYLLLTRLERREVIGYLKFDKALGEVMWEYKVWVLCNMLGRRRYGNEVA